MDTLYLQKQLNQISVYLSFLNINRFFSRIFERRYYDMDAYICLAQQIEKSSYKSMGQ